MPKSPTPYMGWKPRETFSRDGHRGPPPHVQEHLKTCAAANKERLEGQHAEEVKESQEKYDRGGNNSYPRTGRDHNKWCEKKHRSGRHISLTAGDDIGRVRGETHNADTDFEARTHASLDRRALRRNQGGTHRSPTDNSGRKRGRDGSYTGPSQLSATPGLMVVPFHPDEIGIPEPDDDVILVQGQFRIPRRDIVSFLGKKHHLVYSKDREVPVNITVESSRVDEPVNAGPVTTASSSLAESTPSSPIAEPTPVADSAPAASSSVVDPMLVTEPAAGESSSLAEPTSVVGPAAEAPSPMAESTSSVDELPSPGDEAGPKSACEEDEDWVIVEHNDFPTLPTYPGGAIDFSRLELEQVPLVPILEWKFLPCLWKYYGLLGDGNDVAQETNSIAQRSLMNRFLKRQLKADRILTKLDYDFDTLRCIADLDYVRLSDDDKREARARGFTRIWKIDWKNRECRHRRYYLCDKERTWGF
mmetsp:Transcript_13659/g.32201  ORF Transcript_13659/g.32201 Transcript_13659/m.32201 type:complete len:474 (-) Transcript_13659:240-1661(-)